MRNCKFDNIKGILILVVVLGHLLESMMGYGINKLIYILIYSFHMPLFIFTTGYFAKFRPEKIVRNMIYPYLIFQTIYILFDRIFLEKSTALQYTKPYWFLWYLFAVIVWNSLLPLFSVKLWKTRGIVLLLSCLVALGAGYIEFVDRFLSLSRILVFTPFFLLGYYSRKLEQEKKEILLQFLAGKRILFVKTLLFVATAGSVGYCLLQTSVLKASWLYEATSYETGHYTMPFRFFHMAMATMFILLALLLIPKKPIVILADAGKHTMPIYLMHGFVIKLIGKYELFQYVDDKYLAAISIALLLVYLLKSNFVATLIDPLLQIKALKPVS